MPYNRVFFLILWLKTDGGRHDWQMFNGQLARAELSGKWMTASPIRELWANIIVKTIV